MRRLWICLGLVGALIGSSASVASGSTLNGVRTGPKAFPSGCKRSAFTADGGYYSSGHFYWEPAYTVTLFLKWCFSGGVITSHSASYSTNIPSSLAPYVSPTESLIKHGAVLDEQVNASYNSGVINNVSFITIIGDVTARGGHHFANASGSGG